MQVEKAALKLALAATLCAAGAAVSLGAQSRPAREPTRPRRRPGAIPICRASGRAPTWSACPSSGRSSSARGCPSPTRSSEQRQKDAEKQADLDNESFSVDNVKPEIVALGDVGGVTSPPPFWLERGLPSRQSSLLVDPPDGQLPPMTPDGLRRVALDQEHVPAVHRLRRRFRAGALRSLHLARPARLDVPGRLQQRQPVHPDARLRRAAQRDDSRNARDPARRPSAAVADAFAPTWAIRAGASRATRWSCGRRTSTARPARRPTAT